MAQAPEGDAAFRGVNARLRPPLVPAGYVTAARNARFTDGAIRPRRGLQLLPWTNLASSVTGVPDAITSFQGVGVFADPDDTKWIIYAANGAVYYCRPGTAARSIALPAGVTVTGAVEFTQCMDSLLMFRDTEAQLELTNVTDAWATIPTRTNSPDFAVENTTDGTESIPASAWGIAVQNRLLLPNASIGKDVLSISDYFNYTLYQPTLGSFRINQGDEQAVIGAFEVPTPDDTPSSAVLVFKESSIYIVSGLVGDLSGLALQTVTNEYSAVSRKAVWRVGRDVWFLAAGRGVCSLTQTTQNKWQGVDVPVSLDIQPIIDRINWEAAEEIRAMKVGNFSYIAVPLDNATANNAILVYDHLVQAWAGYDTGVAVSEFLRFNYQGVERLFIFTTAGYFGLYEETVRDGTNGSTWAEIDFSVTTRGYALRSQVGRIRATDLSLQLKTWYPRYTITATMDGANETETIATQQTKSRTNYYRPHWATPWVSTNVNLDHATPFREDYSVSMSSDVTLTEVDLDLHQESLESWRPPKGTRGQYVQFTVANDRGRTELHAVSIDSVRAGHSKGTTA